jgi:hypothetical protein
LNAKQAQKVHRQREVDESGLVSRPRRKSIDALMPSPANQAFSALENSGQFKQKVVSHLWTTDKLSTEVQDLKLQNQFLQRRLAEAGSPSKGEQHDAKSKGGQQLVTFEGKGGSTGLSGEELIQRLLQVLRKMLTGHESADRFTNGTLSPAEAVKEVLFEISCKIDELQIQLRRLEGNRQRAASQESADGVNYLSALHNSSPGVSSQLGGPPQLLNQNKTAEKLNPFGRAGLLTSQSQDNVS